MADLSITATNVKKLSGTLQTNLAGATITAGQSIYIDSSQLVQLADADLSTTAALTGGIALNGGVSGQPIAWLSPGGDITIGATVAAGVPYFQSANAGGICPFADLTTGMRTLMIGIGKNATDLTLSMVTSSNQAAHA